MKQTAETIHVLETLYVEGLLDFQNGVAPNVTRCVAAEALADELVHCVCANCRVDRGERFSKTSKKWLKAKAVDRDKVLAEYAESRHAILAPKLRERAYAKRCADLPELEVAKAIEIAEAAEEAYVEDAHDKRDRYNTYAGGFGRYQGSAYSAYNGFLHRFGGPFILVADGRDVGLVTIPYDYHRKAA